MSSYQLDQLAQSYRYKTNQQIKNIRSIIDNQYVKLRQNKKQNAYKIRDNTITACQDTQNRIQRIGSEQRTISTQVRNRANKLQKQFQQNQLDRKHLITDSIQRSQSEKMRYSQLRQQEGIRLKSQQNEMREQKQVERRKFVDNIQAQRDHLNWQLATSISQQQKDKKLRQQKQLVDELNFYTSIANRLQREIDRAK